MAQPYDPLEDWKATHRANRNYWAALHELNLTPQEQHVYNHHRQNFNNGGVPHPDGSISTFLNFTTDAGTNRQYILPQVWDNQILDQRAATARAVKEGLDKWPSYPTWQEAEKRYQQIHKYMERDTVDRRLNANPIGQPPGATDPRSMEGSQPAVAPRFD